MCIRDSSNALSQSITHHETTSHQSNYTFPKTTHTFSLLTLIFSIELVCQRFMCSAPTFCAWRRLPLRCWKLLIGVCVRGGLAASVCVCRTSAASVELRPRGWRAVAFPRWLHLRDRSGSPWLIVILMVRCCFGSLCVRGRLAACLRMSHFCCFR